MEKRKKKDPKFAAAVLKLTFSQRGQEQSAQFLEIYRGVLRDLNLSEEQVDNYLEAHFDEVLGAVNSREKSSGGPQEDE